MRGIRNDHRRDQVRSLRVLSTRSPRTPQPRSHPDPGRLGSWSATQATPAPRGRGQPRSHLRLWQDRRRLEAVARVRGPRPHRPRCSRLSSSDRGHASDRRFTAAYQTLALGDEPGRSGVSTLSAARSTGSGSGSTPRCRTSSTARRASDRANPSPVSPATTFSKQSRVAGNAGVSETASVSAGEAFASFRRARASARRARRVPASATFFRMCSVPKTCRARYEL